MSWLLLGIVLFLFTNANASLTIINDDFVEDGKGLVWYRHLSEKTNSTFSEHFEHLTEMNKYIYADELKWRIANSQDMQNIYDSTYAEVCDAFTPSYDDGWNEVWYGRYDQELSNYPDASLGYEIIFVNGSYISEMYNVLTMDDRSDKMLGAWYVSGTPVPLPTSMLLMASGLVGCIGLKRRFRRLAVVKRLYRQKE